MMVILVLVVGYVVLGALVSGPGSTAGPRRGPVETSPWARRPEPTTSTFELAMPPSNRLPAGGQLGTMR